MPGSVSFVADHNRCAKLRTWRRQKDDADQMLFEVDAVAVHKSLSAELARARLCDPPLNATGDVTVVFRIFASDDNCRTTTQHQKLSVTGPVWTGGDVDSMTSVVL